MLGVLLLLAFASLVHRYHRPFWCAVGFTVVGGVLNLALHGRLPLPENVLFAITYSAAYYFILERVSDSTLLFVLVLLAGLAGFFAIGVWATMPA